MRHATILEEKSYLLALRIVKLSQYLGKTHNEYVLSKQILRSGTSIGALIRESRYAQSRADFLNKQMIALKEANETEYWLHLLKESEYLSEKMFDSISSDMTEILKMLVASTKKTKGSKIKQSKSTQ
jgi:four helix bundle protein